jgi:protein-tyrosine phosphatase
MSHTEIHFHLLPGIDDGPSSIEETLELAAAAAREHTRTIITTPHVHPEFVTDVSELGERVREVVVRLAAKRIPIRVLCGGELAHDMVARLSPWELDMIAQGPPGRRWLLLEAPLAGLDHTYTEAADELRSRGFAVVVAHPERALRWLQQGWPVLEHELAAGSALQVNAWSVAGLYGERMRAIALRLLRTAPRAAIASDAHGGARMPALSLGLDALATAGVADGQRFTDTVPYTLIEHGLAARPSSLAA